MSEISVEQQTALAAIEGAANVARAAGELAIALTETARTLRQVVTPSGGRGYTLTFCVPGSITGGETQATPEGEAPASEPVTAAEAESIIKDAFAKVMGDGADGDKAETAAGEPASADGIKIAPASEITVTCECGRRYSLEDRGGMSFGRQVAGDDRARAIDPEPPCCTHAPLRTEPCGVWSTEVIPAQAAQPAEPEPVIEHFELRTTGSADDLTVVDVVEEMEAKAASKRAAEAQDSPKSAEPSQHVAVSDVASPASAAGLAPVKGPGVTRARAADLNPSVWEGNGGSASIEAAAASAAR